MRRTGILLGCLLLVAGCTSSGGGQPTQDLRSVLLQLSDFPPSWRAYPQSADAGDLLGSIAACTGVAPASGGSKVQSSEFRNRQQRITSTAVEYQNHSDIGKLATALGSPKADGCAAQAARQRVLDALPGATITSAHFTAQEGGVNVAINYAGSVHGVVTVDVEGKPGKVYVDAVFILGNFYYADITFLGVGAPISSNIQHVLTDNVALRAQHM